MELDVPALPPKTRPLSLSIGLANRHGAPAVTAVTAVTPVRDVGKLLGTFSRERLGATVKPRISAHSYGPCECADIRVFT